MFIGLVAALSPPGKGVVARGSPTLEIGAGVAERARATALPVERPRVTRPAAPGEPRS